MLSDKDVGRRCCLSLIWTDRCTLESQADLKWNEEKMIHAVIQTNPEALVLNITLIFLNCYHFITKSGNHWFAFFISVWGQTFLNHCCVWSFITRHQRTPTSNLNKKWSLRVKIAFMLRSREMVLLLADCSTDCDCSKRCSLAFTDWDSTVASS